MQSRYASGTQALDLAQGILDTLREPFIVLDGDLRVEMASRSFYRTFQVSRSETEGRIIFELGNGQWDIPELRQLLQHVIPGGTTIEAYEVEHEFPAIGFKTLLLNAREVATRTTDAKSILLAMEDITARKNAERELRNLALTDGLTGLANRNRFKTALEDALKAGRRFDYGTALLLLDLDEFKAVNDTHGHPFGDALLKAVASGLSKMIREVDLAVRMGGDEFAVVLVGVNRKSDVEELAQRYVDEIGQPFEIEGRTVSVGISVGIALFPGDADNAVDLVRRADIALYRAKNEGRNRYRSFTADMEK
ncbi:MAG: diguanylate cyclase [Rhodospirillales bacterium]